MIRQAEIRDAEGICGIYNYYVVNTNATFEERPVSVGDMRDRIREAAGSFPWLVFEKNGEIAGYALASEWKTRSAYRHSVESSVFVSPLLTGRGIGSRLYERLLAALRERSVHAVMGGIALPNPESVALHEKWGFVKVAQFKEIGRKFDRWLDVGYWQLILSRAGLDAPPGEDPRPAGPGR